MAVIRVEKNSNYTTMSNKHLRDKRISLKAKGLLSQMLSLPDDWGYSIGGLASINQEGEKAIISTLKELKTAGYVVIHKMKPNETESGRYEYTYVVYEDPDQKQDPPNRVLETRGLFQGACTQGVENKALVSGVYINNGDQLTDIQNTETKRTETHKAQSAVDVLIDSYTEDAELKEALREYRESRKALKKPLTEGALKRCLGTLDKLAGSTSEKIAIVNQSIERGWVGLFQIDKRGGNYGRGNAQYRGNPTGNDKPISAGKWDTVL